MNDEILSGTIINNAVYTYENLPQVYKDCIDIDLPNFEIFDENDYEINGQKGRPQEFVHYYLSQLSGNTQPIFNDENEIPIPQKVYELYDIESRTNFNHIGYGFSAVYPFGGSGIYNYGYCGVVIGRLISGDFLCAGYDVNPYFAPKREICYFALYGQNADSINKFVFFPPL